MKTRRRCAATLLTVSSVAAFGVATPSAVVAAPGADRGQPDAIAAGPLDLGPPDLTESRTTRTPQPGVTLTEITRGASDPSLTWTLEVGIPATSTSPDPLAPPRVISDEASAQALADRLRAKGYEPRVEAVARPRAVDVPAGTLGYRVRVGTYPTKAAADAARAELVATGESANAVYTGWDGDRSARGPWNIKVVTIDPRRFRGTLDASYGPNLQDRETTSELSRAAGATIGVNGGYFVFDPAAGAPGDPAGVGVYDGQLLSETVDGRPGLVLRPDARHTSVERLFWAGSATIAGRPAALDGINRVPGLIRNCGGDPTDLPTALPLHDVTCTDGAELVAFTPQFGPATPAGPGREVVLDAGGLVRSVSQARGTSLPTGSSSLQGTGDLADILGQVRIGDRIEVRTRLVDADGRTQAGRRDTEVVNGGPMLVQDGREHITQQRDGFLRPTDPSFSYGFVAKRNPRTFGGVDARGRTVLVTADGRSTQDLGLSVPESADVARSLGLVDAMNLDGGGSTTMVLQGNLISRPSDATGERPVGDALLVLPTRRHGRGTP